MGDFESAAARLALYRKSARGLNVFYARWTAAFCARCLEVTRRHHFDDPRADVDLVEGVFPGCCHSGAGDNLWVPGFREEGRFSHAMQRAMERARRALAPAGGPAAATYRVRERQTGRVAGGVACAHLGSDRCRLGDLKGPLCLVYLCDPVRAALAEAAETDLVGNDSDDFCESRRAFMAVVSADLDAARCEVERLEERLDSLRRRLTRRGFRGAADVYRFWDSGGVP